jgi:hypothetical protein
MIKVRPHSPLNIAFSYSFPNYLPFLASPPGWLARCGQGAGHRRCRPHCMNLRPPLASLDLSLLSSIPLALVRSLSDISLANRSVSSITLRMPALVSHALRSRSACYSLY